MNSMTRETAQFYHAYGMRIRSEIRLPELAPSTDRAAPLALQIVHAPQVLPAETVLAQGGFIFDETGSHFRWNGVGGFSVSPDGSQLTVEREPGVSDDLIAFPLLGPVLSEVLRRKGFFVLHASAVAIDGRGVALLADKGTGKSSSAGALLRGGAQMLADDLVAIDPATRMIVPGFSQIKLSEGNLAHQLAGTDWTARPPVHDLIDKVRVLLPDRLATAPVPVRRLYLLERGTDDRAMFAPLTPPERLPALLRFSYAPRFGDAALKGPDAATHFRAAAQVVNAVPIARLATPGGLDRLDGLIDAIRADLERDDVAQDGAPA